jgi:hypothetical protein
MARVMDSGGKEAKHEAAWSAVAAEELQKTCLHYLCPIAQKFCKLIIQEMPVFILHLEIKMPT